jgi:hypothetical protein
MSYKSFTCNLCGKQKNKGMWPVIIAAVSCASDHSELLSSESNGKWVIDLNETLHRRYRHCGTTVRSRWISYIVEFADISSMSGGSNCRERVVRRKDCAALSLGQTNTNNQQLTSRACWQLLPLAAMSLKIFGLLLLQVPLAWFILHVYGLRLRSTNRTRRSALFRELDIIQDDKIRVVGFFHPYW